MPNIVTVFGFERADFVTPGETPTFSQIRGVTEAEITYEMEKAEIKGDDDIIAYWNHSQKGSITIKSAIIDLEVYETITGNAVSTDAGPPETSEILFGTDAELTPSEFMLRLRQRAKDPNTSDPRYRDIYIFRCVGTIKPVGMKHGESIEVEISADMLKATTDEKGNDLSEPAFGKQVISALS